MDQQREVDARRHTSSIKKEGYPGDRPLREENDGEDTKATTDALAYDIYLHKHRKAPFPTA